jgi:hypothetical protein
LAFEGGYVTGNALACAVIRTAMSAFTDL